MSPDPNNTRTHLNSYVQRVPNLTKHNAIIGKANQPVFRLTMSSLKIGSFLDAARVWKGFWNMRARHGGKKSGGQALDSMKQLDQLRNSRNMVKAVHLPEGIRNAARLHEGTTQASEERPH